ncbi:DoxX family protein [Streptomyces sp. NBC_01341]|uniref:DoxX family protein n=1 Tax=Streptomyces sp. NBC_01341 TaxID=2903831 RepID=UPI002E107F1B|nr:DoxX family protein [Streptomyces sp. NBC_01341]
MYIAAVVLSILLALATLAAGAPKAQLKGDVPDGLIQKGLSATMVRLIGLAEVAAGIGLVVGIWWQPLGIAAAAGLAVVFLGAISFHTKWGDYRDSAARNAAMAPVIFLVLAVASAITLAASL